MMIFEAFSERAVVCLLFCEKAVSQKKKNKKKKSNMHASHVLLLKINTSHYITHTHTRTDDKAAAHIFLTRTSAHA
jgi:hypothetical protein